MTARDLIASIFGRVQEGMAGHQRVISRKQLDWLRDLIEQEAAPGTVRAGTGGSLVWTPAGRDTFILTEDRVLGTKHVLTRLANLTSSAAGNLFDPPSGASGAG